MNTPLVAKPGDRLRYLKSAGPGHQRPYLVGDVLVVTRPASIEGGWLAVEEHDPEGREWLLHPRQLRDGKYVRVFGSDDTTYAAGEVPEKDPS